MKTVFNEFYGEISVDLNRAIKKHNVTPAQYDTIEAVLEDYIMSFEEQQRVIVNHIKAHSDTMYQEPWPLTASVIMETADN